MATIKRSEFLSLIESQGSSPEYHIIGGDLEEFIVSMNANVVKKANILGENSILIDKYEKEASVTPYIAESGTDLFEWLQGIVDDEETLDDLETNMVYVKKWEDAVAGEYPAIKEDVVVEVVSYGGNTEGYQIPFNVHFKGNKTVGTFNPTTSTFTEST